MDTEKLEYQWERVREALRALRGRNRFRGREEHLLPQGKVRLYNEDRGDESRAGFMEIRLSDEEQAIKAVEFPNRKEYFLKDFGYQMEEFISHLLDEVRGEAYLRTNSKNADYRNRYGSAKQNESRESEGKNG